MSRNGLGGLPPESHENDRNLEKSEDSRDSPKGEIIPLSDMERQFLLEGALPLITAREKEDSGSLATLAENLLSVRSGDFQFFAPGQDSTNLYQVYQGTALPMVYGEGAMHKAEKQVVVDTPDGQKTVSLSEEVLVTRTGKLSAQTLVRKRMETEGAKVELLTRVASSWTAGFLPEPLEVVGDPLLLARVEPKRLGGPVEKLEQVLKSPPVGTQIVRKSGQAEHMGHKTSFD